MLIRPIREQSNLINQQQALNNAAGVNNNFPSGFNEFSSNNTSLAVHKQAFYSIAKIIASLTVINQLDGKIVIEQFINDIKVKWLLFFIIFFSQMTQFKTFSIHSKDPKSRDSTRLLALLCLGETGKYMLVFFFAAKFQQLM